MSMHNSETDFYGRQEGERILYVVKPHPISAIFSLLRIFAFALIVSAIIVIIGSVVKIGLGIFVFVGILIFVLSLGIGTKIVLDWQAREIAYLTDRRIIRFEPTTLFATNSRTLAWDEVVKVKTYPPNFVLKQMAIGNVVVQARTPARPDGMGSGEITADDIELKSVYFYRDLGNYIDKILFTYKQMPSEIKDIRPFVPKPKGERY